MSKTIYRFLQGELHFEEAGIPFPSSEYGEGREDSISFHCEYGPAVIQTKGDNEYRAWWLYGLRHRIDGPAITHLSGTKSYYLFGKRVEEDLFYKLIQDPEKVLVSHLLDDKEAIRRIAKLSLEKLRSKNEQ